MPVGLRLPVWIALIASAPWYSASFCHSRQQPQRQRVGWTVQLHFYFDDLFPTTIGRPIFPN